MNTELLGDSERFFIIRGVQTGVRADGRKLDDFRNIEVETGFLNHTNASSHISQGNTQIVCTIKIEEGKPENANPSQGRVIFNTEWSPTATHNLQKKTAQEQGERLTSYFQDGIGLNVGRFFALDKLCISKAVRCWIVYVDFLVLVADGNVIDAASLAFKSSLSDLKLPFALEALNKNDPNGLIAIDQVPLYVTSSKVGDKFLVDTSFEEESCSLASISMALLEDGTCVGFTSQGCGSLSGPSYREMIKNCMTLGKEMHTALDQSLLKQNELKIRT